MKLGIFAKTFARDTVEQNLDAVRAHGFVCTQYNLCCAGLPTLPNVIRPEVCERIRQAHQQRGLSMAAISGTFNIMDPSRARLAANMRCLAVLVEATPLLQTSVITLCSGTRDPENMWRGHPDNNSPAAWNEMVSSIRKIVVLAQQQNINVAVEPELNNVVNSAPKARRLLDEIASPHLRIVLDAANLVDASNLDEMSERIDEAVELLGRDLAIVHAKDINSDGTCHVAAGTGVLDYDYYLHRLNQCGFDGPLMLHGLEEGQVADSVRFLNSKLVQPWEDFESKDVSRELRDANV